MQVAPQRPAPRQPEEFGQVLQFPRRPGLAPSAAGVTSSADPAAIDSDAKDADDLARYEQEQDEPIDYRQRMLMNAIAGAIVVLLIGAGVWIADTIAGMDRDQDCVMQGRGNCAPLEASVSTQRQSR
jgi:hypothetical protein